MLSKGDIPVCGFLASAASNIHIVKIDHRGSWVQIPSGAWVFFQVPICHYVYLWHCIPKHPLSGGWLVASPIYYLNLTAQ